MGGVIMGFKDESIKFIENILRNLDKSDIADVAQLIMESIDNKTVMYVPIEENKIKILNFSDIHHVVDNNRGSQLTIYTLESNYIYTNSKFDLFNYLEESGKNFRVLSNGIMVNLNYVKNYDSLFFKVYMVDGLEIISNSKAIKNFVKTYVGSALDLNNARTAVGGEYSRRSFFKNA